MVTNTMANNTTTLAHIGSIKQSDGVLRIDIKTRQCVIARTDVPRLMERWPVSIYDISNVISTCGQPEPIGQAWISRSGRAVMLRIDGLSYVAPLAQVKGILSGERKYAHLSIITEYIHSAQPSSAAVPCAASGVPA